MTSVVRWLLHWLGGHRLRVAVAVTLAAATLCAAIAMMGTAGDLISSAALQPATILLLWVPIVGVRFFGISRAVARYLERWMSHDVALRLAARLRGWVYRGIERHPSWLIGMRTSHLLDAILSDMEQLQDMLIRILLPATASALVSLGMGAWLAQVSAVAAFTYMVGVVLAGAALPMATHALTRRAQEEWRALREERTALADDALRGLEETLAYGMAPGRRERFREVCQRERRLAGRLGAVRGAAEGLNTVISLATVTGVLLAAVSAHAHGRLPGVMLAAIALATMASLEGWSAIGPAFAGWQEMYTSAQRVMACTPTQIDAAPGLQAEAEAFTGMSSRFIPAAAPSVETGLSRGTEPRASAADTTLLSIRHLYARYAPDEPWILRDISLDVRPGQKVAIVGETGSGKSTLLQVLLGFLPAARGQVRWLNQDVREWPESDLRTLVSLVPQQAYLFHHTLRQNLRLARPEATEEELWEALRVAQLDDFVRGLPEGLDTVVGEQGMRLSGGQRQRVALARVILHGSPVILCDEPTAGLDAEMERAFIEAFFAAARDKTVLWVTHRLTHVDRMDWVLVLHDGAVVEAGRHEELLAREERYARLWQLHREAAALQAAH